MSPTAVEPREDGRQDKRVDGYTKFWQKDIGNEARVDTDNRLDNYTDVVNGAFKYNKTIDFFFSDAQAHPTPSTGYYDGATEFYEYGWSKCFHFSRFYKGEGFYASLARHEHYLASHMQLRPGMRVLDVGCGVGGPAREIAQFSDANIVGLNNNDFQIMRARKYTQKAGLANQVTYVKGDFMKLTEQFGENSFDAVYAIEATCHAPTWEGVYGEIMKVLKPGGVVSACKLVTCLDTPSHTSL